MLALVDLLEEVVDGQEAGRVRGRRLLLASKETASQWLEREIRGAESGSCP